MKRQTSLQSGSLILAIAALTLACQTPPGVLTTYELKIVQAANGCPLDVEVPSAAECPGHRGKPCAKKNEKLVWVADRPFKIYFDPFRGHEIKSPLGCSGTCKTSPVKIDPDVPPAENDTLTEVEYKYTIVVTGCQTPLDPPIFIQR